MAISETLQRAVSQGLLLPFYPIYVDYDKPAIDRFDQSAILRIYPLEYWRILGKPTSTWTIIVPSRRP